MKTESKPSSRGTHYGQLSPGGHWMWKGTGGASDDWVVQVGQQKAPEVLAQPAAGTAIPGTTTIDALFTTLFATRSGDLGAASYAWSSAPNTIVATFPSGTTTSALNGCALFAKLEARSVYPSSIRP